jgi:protocatechuate 3,4-dioxygenase beta subunit
MVQSVLKCIRVIAITTSSCFAGEFSMRKLSNLAAILALILSLGTNCSILAQDQKQTGSITGHVKIDGKPAPGVTIIVSQSDPDVRKTVEQMFNRQAPVKVVTDSDGFYRVEGLPPGKYDVEPSSPTMVVSDDNDEIAVAEGSTTEGVDFGLSPGGVITGKITDADGKPIIGEVVSMKPLDTKVGSGGLDSLARGVGNLRMFATDDRGIYRIYGIQPGRYLVSAGKRADVMSMLSQRPKQIQTFYPNVTEEARAKPVQVSAGGEATGIDIQLSLNDKGFTISGRVVDAEKNTPVTNAMVVYSRVKKITADKDGDPDATFDIGDLPGAFTTTNDKGEFKFLSVLPGSYKLEAGSMGGFSLSANGGSQFYADPVNFEVASSNVDKLDVKVHRGSSITGVVVMESNDQQDSLDRVGQLVLMATVSNASNKIPTSSGNCMVAADGSFRVGGLKPGKVTVRPFALGAKQLAVARVERNGVDVREGFEIQPDEDVTGLRVVLAPSAGVVRGRVLFAGGPAPANVRVEVSLHPSPTESSDGTDFLGNKETMADAKGNFLLDGLAPGTYLIEAVAKVTDPRPRSLTATQLVTVTNERPVEIELTIDLRGKDSDK